MLEPCPKGWKRGVSVWSGSILRRLWMRFSVWWRRICGRISTLMSTRFHPWTTCLGFCKLFRQLWCLGRWIFSWCPCNFWTPLTGKECWWLRIGSKWLQRVAIIVNQWMIKFASGTILAASVCGVEGAQRLTLSSKKENAIRCFLWQKNRERIMK